MRIAHVIDYFHTDVGYQEFFLARCMARAGHEVRVVSSRFRHHSVPEPGPDEARGADELEAAGVEVVRLEGRQLGHDRTWLSGLEAALQTFRPDVVHAHGPFNPTTVRVAYAARRGGFSLLVDNHMQAFIAPGASSLGGRAFYRGFRTGAGPLLRRRVDHWVAIGPYEREFVCERLSLDTATVDLVPLGFDPAVFGFDAARRETRRAEQGWSDDLVVVVSGKLHPGKRPELAAAACAEVAKDRPVRLVLAGTVDDESRRAVQQAGKPLEAEGRLQFMPMLGRMDLADLYLCADVVAFPRLPSISIYEAAGTGVRLLVGRDEFSEWLHTLHAPIEAVDPDDLAASLAAVEPSERAARADAAAATFGWDSISEQFVHLYQAPARRA